MKIVKSGDHFKITMTERQLKTFKKLLEKAGQESARYYGHGDDIVHLNDSFVTGLFRMRIDKKENQKSLDN